MSRAILVIAFIACALPTQADDAKHATVKFVGGSKKVPLDGLKVTLFQDRGDFTEDRKAPTAQGTTDKTGATEFDLFRGRYYVEISSSKELPYLQLPLGYKDTTQNYIRTINVNDEQDQTFEFKLAMGCQLTLKAMDVETGKPLQGIEFAIGNDAAEIWEERIHGDNLGALGETAETQKTGPDGTVTRLVGPRSGFKYFVWPQPTGYDLLGDFEVEIPTPVGTERAEHVFKFKKKRRVR